jgi:hypothetical protein
MADAISYALLQELAALNAGRGAIPRPQGWVFGSRSGPPSLITDGVATEGATVATAGLRLRRSPSSFRALLRIDSVDSGSYYGPAYGTWQTALHGFARGYVPGAVPFNTAPLLVAGIKSVLDASALFVAAGGVAAAHASASSVLIMTTTRPLGWRLDGISDGGWAQSTTRQSLMVEASAAIYRLWGLHRVSGLWLPLTAPTWTTDPTAQSRVMVAGYTRVAVEVVWADGATLPWVAPAVSEVNTTVADAAATAAWAAANATGELAFPTPSVGTTGRVVTATDAAAATNPDTLGQSVVEGHDLVLSVVPLSGSPSYRVEVWGDGPARAASLLGAAVGTASYAQRVVIPTEGITRAWAMTTTLAGSTPIIDVRLQPQPRS